MGDVIRVEVVDVACNVHSVEVSTGCTIGEALRYSGVDIVGAAGVGVYGRCASLTDIVKPGDRIELYRSLRQDPKSARRHRADLSRRLSQGA